MPGDPLEQQMIHLVHQLALLSQASAAPIGKDPRSSTTTRVGPPPADAPHTRHWNNWLNARTPDERQAAIDQAQEELTAHRYSRCPHIDVRTLEGRLTIALDPRPATTVAYIYRYSPRHIYRLRHEARDRLQRLGIPLPDHLQIRPAGR